MTKKQSVLDGVEFLDLWQETLFIGQEFLTWLWISSEVDNRFTLKNDLEVEVWFENSLRLESGQGDTKRQISCQTAKETASHEWAEAFMAVMLKKQVNSGKVKIKTLDKEWTMTLPADTLAPKSVKTPPIADPGPGEGSLGHIGQLIDRISLFSELCGIIEALLRHFLELRLSPQWKSEEIPRLRGWLVKWDQEARGTSAE